MYFDRRAVCQDRRLFFKLKISPPSIQVRPSFLQIIYDRVLSFKLRTAPDREAKKWYVLFPEQDNEGDKLPPLYIVLIPIAGAIAKIQSPSFPAMASRTKEC